GSDPRELSREFSAVRQLRPDIGKPVWHCSLSLPPGEQCQTGLPMSGRNWRTAENSRDSSRGSLPAMLPPTR
ncbi:relaxase/mobilization nuclease domain-containing protein, partial [Aeromonas caviae]|uniref:relaxase/mobilization nuclease domain-containing protein n=1 Tax=Aeromonas caviae TaxID=648 RepID=UPI0035A25AE4